MKRFEAEYNRANHRTTLLTLRTYKKTFPDTRGLQSNTSLKRTTSHFGRRIRIALFPAVLFISACQSPNLSPFTSDGCSAFPDGTLQHRDLWLECCEQHDLAYWRGGTYQQRHQADLDLQQCVAQVGQEEIAQLMLAGVRVGGTPFLPTTFRWGYGWPYPRGYRTPTSDEQQQIDRLLGEQDK